MGLDIQYHSVRKLATALIILLFMSPWLTACGNIEAQQSKALAAATTPGIAHLAPKIKQSLPTPASLADRAFTVKATEIIEPTSTPTRPALVGGSPPIEAKVGFLAPDFTMQTLDGMAIRKSDLRGQPVLINYWVSWCLPCKEEMPILEKIHQDYQQKGLQVVSVDAIEQDSLEDVREMMDNFQLSFPVMLDEGDTFKNSYQASFFPTNYFIDANGIIREIILGSSTSEKLISKVEWLLLGEY